MKKNILLTIVLIFCCFVFSSCYKSDYKICVDSISEYRHCLFISECESFNASFTSGKRENSFQYDGVADKLVAFGVLTIKFNFKYAGILPNFVLYIDSLQYSGLLEFNPFDGTYVADIEKEISEKCDIYLRVHASGIEEKMDMVCLSKNWEITYLQAFNIVVNNSKDIIKQYISNNKINGEFFIKIVGDTSADLQVYWYVYFVAFDGKSLAYIVDTDNGEIIAKKHITN